MICHLGFAKESFQFQEDFEFRAISFCFIKTIHADDLPSRFGLTKLSQCFDKINRDGTEQQFFLSIMLSFMFLIGYASFSWSLAAMLDFYVLGQTYLVFMVLVKANFAINKSCGELCVDSKNMLSFYVAPTVWTILTQGSLEKLKGIPFQVKLVK